MASARGVAWEEYYCVVIELKLDDDRVVSVWGFQDTVLLQGCRSFSLDGCCYIHCNILSFSVGFAVRLAAVYLVLIFSYLYAYNYLKN